MIIRSYNRQLIGAVKDRPNGRARTVARKRNEAAFAARQQEILRAAEALFVAHGFHQTGMAAICEAAGMSPGALYRYFPSKASIIQAIVQEERADIAGMLERLAGAADFRGTLVDMLVETIAAVRDQDYARLALEIAAEGLRDGETGALLTQAHAAVHAELAAIIAAAQDDGRIGQDADAAAAAQVLLMLVDGAIGFAGASPAPSPAAQRRTLARVVDGLFAPAG